MRVGIWELQGNERQQNIIRTALEASDFPDELMQPEILRQAGRDYIPVEWLDLSRFAGAQEAAASSDDHDHVHNHTHGPDDQFDFLAARGRVLGLAWYSLKVSLDLSLEFDPRLGMEVFLSEAAHMVDFTILTNEQREAIWDVHHAGQDNIGSHGHGWFDVGQYRDYVGESFMGDFIYAYAPSIPVTIPFSHNPSRQKGLLIRQIVTPGIDDVAAPELPPTPEPEPEPPVAPETPETPTEEPEQPPVAPQPVFGSTRGKTYHDKHARIPEDIVWDSPQAAVDAGRRPCKTCKPPVPSAVS